MAGSKITGPELARLLGRDDYTTACRLADQFGMPGPGSGYRLSFTIGQAVAAMMAAGLADRGHTQYRAASRAVLHLLPWIVDERRTRWVLFAREHGDWHCDRDELVEPLLDRWRHVLAKGDMIHLVDTHAALEQIEQTLGRAA